MGALFAGLLLFGGGAAYTVLMSGWHLLAKQYRDVEPAAPVRRISEGSYWANARLRFIPIGMLVELYPEGIWLRAPFPINLVFGNVLVPWQDLTLKEGRGRFLWFGRPALLGVKLWPHRLVFYGQAATAIRKKLDAML